MVFFTQLLAAIIVSATSYGLQFGTKGECQHRGLVFIERPIDERGWRRVDPTAYTDLVESLHDTPSLRKGVIDFLHKWWSEGDTALYLSILGHPDFADSGVSLLSVIEFPESPDFALLEIDQWVTPLPTYFGYVNSVQKGYPLVDYDDNGLEVNLNRMLEENPGILSMSPLCRAVFYLALKYQYSRITVLDSFDEIAPALNINVLGDNLGKLSGEELYLMHLAKDTALSIFFRIKDHGYLRDLADGGWQDSIDVKPPVILEGVEKDTVRLCVYAFCNGELAQWRVVTWKDGRIAEMAYEKGPYLTVGFGCPSASPLEYMKDRAAMKGHNR